LGAEFLREASYIPILHFERESDDFFDIRNNPIDKISDKFVEIMTPKRTAESHFTIWAQEELRILRAEYKADGGSRSNDGWRR